MNRLRTHKARLTVVVLVWLGFSLYMVQPIQAEQSSQAFASWLSSMAKSHDGVELQRELAELHDSGDHLDAMIKKASRIVSSNNDDFEFTFEGSIASNHLYQLLLIEWNQFKTGNEMAGLPTHPSVKVLIPAALDKVGSLYSAIAVSDAFDTPFYGGEVMCKAGYLFAAALVPMAEGIAIGAP